MIMQKTGILCAFLLGGTVVSNAGKTEFSSPLLKGKNVVSWQFEQLQSAPGKKEIFKKVSPEQIKVTLKKSIQKLADGAVEYQFNAVNKSGKQLFLRSVIELTVNRKKVNFFNGYENMRKIVFDPNDVTLSNWFPTNAAYDNNSALILGLNPMDLYSRIDSGRIKDKNGNVKLYLATPFVLEPGKSFTWSYVVAACHSRYGRHDIVQHWYELFPKAFGPADKINRSVLSGESSYAYWKPQKIGYKFVGDLIRRMFGGRGSWEWCYAPSARAGDWATTDKWSVGFRGHTKKTLEAHRQRIRKRLEPAAFLDVAPMWYLNVCWMEWTLWETHFKNIYPTNAPKPRKMRCWGSDALYGVYSWGNDYAKLFIESINRIPKEYPAAKGIGWDSCFAHRLFFEDTDGVKNTERKSFKDGKIFALEAAGVANLLDANHKNFTGKQRMANVVNFKLVTPYMIGVRSDAALYEGHPMKTENRLLRFETMCARLGTGKSITWHKGAAPSHMKWVDWEEMDKKEAQDAYRQLMENNLFLSYYWGGTSAPQMPTIGVKFLFDAIPELVDLIRLGRQASPAVDAPAELLVTRYGQGVGSRIVIINPQFKSRNAKIVFRPEYWNGLGVMAAREDGTEMTTRITQSGTNIDLTIPARKIIILRVCATGPLKTANLKDIIVKSNRIKVAGKAPFWRFNVLTNDKFEWPVTFFRDEPGARVRVRVEDDSEKFSGKVVPQLTLTSAKWKDDVQANNRRNGLVELHEYPLNDVSKLTAEQIRDLKLIEAVKQGKLAIQVADNAPQVVKDEAERICEWFRFYTCANSDKFSQPEITSKPKPGMKVIQLIGNKEQAGLKSWQLGRAFKSDDSIITIAAQDADALKQTNLAFLNLMDTIYPFSGTLPNTKEFEKLGLAGKTLTREKAVSVFHPTLLEMLRKTGVK